MHGCIHVVSSVRRSCFKNWSEGIELDQISDFQICFLIFSVTIEVSKQYCFKYKLVSLVKLSWKAAWRRISEAISWLSGKKFYNILMMPAIGISLGVMKSVIPELGA